MKRGFDAYTFELDAASDRMLRQSMGALPTRVTVGLGTRAEFENLHGPIAAQVVPLLTGRSLEGLGEQRVEVVDVRTGDVIWKWPQAPQK